MGLLTGKWFVIGPGREPTPEVTRRQLESRLTFGTEAEGRYELDDRGLRLYDSVGELVANLKTLDGTAMFGDADGTHVFIDPTRQGSVLFFDANMDNEGSIQGGGGALFLEAPYDTGNTPATVHMSQGTGAAVLLQPLLKLVEQPTPATPTVNTVIIYPKDKAGVSTLYYKNDAGTEYELGPTAAHTHTESEITDFAHTHGAGDLPAAPPTNVFLSRALVQAATWTNAPADGWEDWGGTSPLTVTVTKAQAGTRLLVEYGFTIFSDTAAPTFNFAVHESVTATRYDQFSSEIVASATGEHLYRGGDALISGLGTGSHTLKLQLDNTHATANVRTLASDYGHIRVWEVA